MLRYLAAIVASALFVASAHAQMQADYNHAVDGDTANLDIWLTESLINRGNVRLAGVDTPELRGKCDEEKRMAIEAKNYLDQALSDAGTITVFPVTWSDKYGRPVVRVLIDGKDASEHLIKEGLGRPYDGGKRDGWCD